MTVMSTMRRARRLTAADGDRVEVAHGKIPPEPLTGTSLAEGPEVIVIE
jgi:hypothetical protein